MSYPHVSCLLLSLSLIPLTPLAGLSEQPVSRPSLQQSSPSKLIPPRPFTVNKETMDHLARTPLNVPNSLTGQEHQALRKIAEQIKAHDAKSATNGWSALLTTLNQKNVPVDVNQLVQFALREAYGESNDDLRKIMDKIKRFNYEKSAIREVMAGINDQHRELSSGKQKPPSGKPPYPPDPDAEKRAVLTKSLRQWEERLSKLNGDEQLANVDMQNMEQRQQQTLQMMSQISKMLHDTAMAVIRKIGG